MTDKDKVKQAMANGHVSVVDIGKLVGMDPERVKVLMGDICYEQYLEHKEWWERTREFRPYDKDEIDAIIRFHKDGLSNREIAEALNRAQGSIGVKITELRREGRL